MAKYKYGNNVNCIAGTLFGLCVGIILSTWNRNKLILCVPTFTQQGCCMEKYKLNSDNKVTSSQFTIKENSNNVVIEDADEKGFLFVGIMTAKQYLDSRAVAAFQTWARSINGKVVFFSSEDSTSINNIPFISLKNVDDSYPPQKKSFSMLKYISDYYIDKYEWFMRADDDIFVKGDKLEKFLRSINSSKPQYIGQAGIGTKEEIGLLSLGDMDNYCMGGTGMVFSQETLRLISPHLKFCINNLYTSHEDVEIGRCVKRFAGIPCTWAFEMQKYFHQNFKEYKGSFVNSLLDAEVQEAITLHPIKMPSYQYRINNHFTAAKIMELKQKSLELHREMNEMNQMLNKESEFDKYGLKTSVNTYLPQKAKDVIAWEFFNSKSISSHLKANPKQGLTSFRKKSLDKVVAGTMMDIIKKSSRQRGRSIEFKEVLYGYTNINPLNGPNYILDVLLSYQKHKGNNLMVPVRHHPYLHQSFTLTEFIESPFSSKQNASPTPHSSNTFPVIRGKSSEFAKLEENIHFVLPLAGKVKEFQKFMKNYEEICLIRKENSQMHIVLFTENTTAKEVKEILAIVGIYQKRYGGHLLEVIEADGDFARAKALDLGAKQCSFDDLIFCVDVDIILTVEALHRIRLNTIKNVQVYYPIVFSQYDPSVVCRNGSRSQCNADYLDFSGEMGHWRQFGYGIAAMYRSDLEIVGGYDTSIQGWGKEDVDLYEKYVFRNLTIFRAVDTGMIHTFHPINCDMNLEPAKFQMCLGSKAACWASQSQLAEMVLNMNLLLNWNEDRGS